MTTEELARFGLFVIVFIGSLLGTGFIGAIVALVFNNDAIIPIGAWFTSIIIIAIMAQFIWKEDN